MGELQEAIANDPTALWIVGTFTAVGFVLDILFYIFVGAGIITFIKKKWFKKGV
jgi:hypothetical protein